MLGYFGCAGKRKVNKLDMVMQLLPLSARRCSCVEPPRNAWLCLVGYGSGTSVCLPDPVKDKAVSVVTLLLRYLRCT